MIGPEQDKKASGKSGKKKAKAKKAKRRAAERDVVPSAMRPDVETRPLIADEPVAAADPEPRLRADAAADAATPRADAVPDVGPELLAWIDRVQARVDHLLTLVDPAPATPVTAPAPAAAPEPATTPASASAPTPAATATPDPTSAAPPEPEAPESAEPEAPQAAEPEAAEPESAEPQAAEAEAAEPEAAAPEDVTAAPAPVPSLAEAWARRQQQETVASFDEPDDEDEPFEPVDARLTAVLVARELIARGESAAAVRRRLREGYGVVDPDAVLAQVAA